MKTSGTDSPNVNQEQLLQETLEMATMALSSLACRLGEVLEGLAFLQISLTKYKKSLPSNFKPEVDGVSGQLAAENSVLDERG